MCGAKENFAETMRQLSVAWRNMSEEEKNRYRDAAAKSKSSGGRRARSKSGASTGTGSRQRRAASVSTTENLSIIHHNGSINTKNSEKILTRT